MKKREQKDFINAVIGRCEREGLRITDPRRHVLDIVVSAEKPIGAYDILDALATRMDKPKPPTAYRAIDFWIEQGALHKIESLNAFIACHTDHRHEGSQFMICDRCGTVIETHLCDLPAPLAEKTQENHFQMTRWNVELHGLCARCQ